MDVRILRSVLLHPEGEVGPGEVRAVPDAVAERLIRLGYAESVGKVPRRKRNV